MTNPSRSPWRASTVLFDMDDTMTGPSGQTTGKTFGTVLADVVARCNGLDRTAAEARIRSTFDIENETVDAHYAALGIRPEDLWGDLVEWVRVEVQGYPDAVEAVKVLDERGFRLATATTNARLMCLAKLHVAGLATRTGSPYFDHVLGGSEVHPAGKTCPAFFESLLALLGADGGDVVMVGDNPVADLLYARQAGIHQVALVCRDQQQACVRTDVGALILNSLAVLPDLIGHRPRGT